MASIGSAVPKDSPEARRYNRIRRWLGIAEFVLLMGFLVVLLVTAWLIWGTFAEAASAFAEGA